MKIFNLVLAVVFGLFAVVQLNDTPGDILFWFILYAAIAVMSAFAAFNRFHMWAILLGMAVVVFELFRQFPGFAQWIGMGMPSIVDEMKATTPYVELAREYLGLVLCLAILIFHYVRYAGQRKKESPFVE